LCAYPFSGAGAAEPLSNRRRKHGKADGEAYCSPGLLGQSERFAAGNHLVLRLVEAPRIWIEAINWHCSRPKLSLRTLAKNEPAVILGLIARNCAAPPKWCFG